ncbi:hypothetical protein TNCV_4307621 [Trichonephila clavipes]|nr:hypothetical protein TNCV_4307621 [Trichonephila clavipes]
MRRRSGARRRALAVTGHICFDVMDYGMFNFLIRPGRTWLSMEFLSEETEQALTAIGVTSMTRSATGSFLQCQRAYSCKNGLYTSGADAAEKFFMRSSERYEIPRASS